MYNNCFIKQTIHFHCSEFFGDYISRAAIFVVSEFDYSVQA